MSKALQVFKYSETHEIRTTIIDGEVWFVAKDVCNILGLTNPTKALSSLDNDEKMTLTNSEGHSGQRGGAQSYNVINEAGLYALVFRSNKPEAKAFSRWVRREVLPSIRKSGMYLTETAADAYETNPELFAAMAKRCSTLERKVAAMERTLSARYSLSVLGC